MGRRGPKPTPTAILRLRGSRRADGRGSEPLGPAGTPDPPGWLDDEARQAWDQLVPMLERMGVLTKIDSNALSRYCRLWSRWRKAEGFIDQHGEMYPLKDESGKVKYMQPFPQVSIAANLAQQLARLEQEFGMTPASRTRIQVQVFVSDPEKAKFFG